MFALVEPERFDVLVGQLDQDDDVLGTAPATSRERTAERIAMRWDGRLSELLARHPAMSAGLPELVGLPRSASGQPGPARPTQYRQRIEAKDHGSAFGVQGGNLYYYGSAEP